MKKVKSLITMAAALALVGCSQDDLMQGVENHADGAIGVNAYVPTTTRGTAVNSVGDLVKSENGFDLFAFKVNSDGESYDESLFMGDGTTGDGVAFIGNGSNGIYTWDYKDNTEKRFWSEAQNAALKFYAVSPMDEVTASISLEKTLNNTVRKISYTVPFDAKDQVDLMYAVSDKYGSDKNETANKNHMENGISLQFHHALSQIVFKVKTTEEEVFADIKNIEITNIKNSGYFNLDNEYDPLTNTENFWTLNDSKDTQKVRMSDSDDDIITDINTHPNEYGYDNETTYSGGYYGSETDGSLTDSKKALLLLPQNLKDNASELVISCRINFSGKNGEVNILPASNNIEEYAEVRIPLTTEWKPGFKYNYTLIFSAEMGNPIKVETIAVDKWNDTWSDFGDDNINIPQNTAEVAKDGKFYIYNADQLKDVRDKINQDKSYSFNDETHRYNEATYILKDNIDLEGNAWTPIKGTAHRNNENGDYTVRTFEGTFDGNGFEIRNLSLNSTEDYYGFFTQVDGTLKNIKIVNDATTLVKFSHENCGVIAGWAQDATVENCSVNATIQLDKACSIGGLFGSTNGSDVKATTVSRCTFEGSITGTGDACGGIAGLVNTLSKVIDCVNKGNASYTYFLPDDIASQKNPEKYLAGNGGIAGHVGGIIEHCSNEGNITGYYVGGIEGGRLNGGSPGNFMGIIACNNSGTITGTKAGGISYKVEDTHQILKCYNTGLISGTESQGGIAAAIAGNTLMLGCYNIGTFGNNDSAKTAHIVAENVKSSWSPDANIINCYWGKEDNDYTGVCFTTDESSIITSATEDWASVLNNLNTTDYNEKIVHEGAGIYSQYEYEISGTYPVLLKK